MALHLLAKVNAVLKAQLHQQREVSPALLGVRCDGWHYDLKSALNEIPYPISWLNRELNSQYIDAK